jgi:two-component system sensor histidine kinase/response regulator
MVDARNALPVLDREALLDRVGGDREFLQEIASLFIQDCPRLLGGIKAAVSREDAQGLEHAAHTLKGSVANFGAEAARQAAFRLEALARSGDLTPAAEALSALERELGRFTEALAGLSRELSSTTHEPAV